MTASAWVVWLDIEAPQAFLGPVHALLDIPSVLDVTKKHDGTEVLKPVATELVGRHSLDHGVSISTLDLAVELVAEIGEQ